MIVLCKKYRVLLNQMMVNLRVRKTLAKKNKNYWVKTCIACKTRTQDLFKLGPVNLICKRVEKVKIVREMVQKRKKGLNWRKRRMKMKNKNNFKRTQAKIVVTPKQIKRKEQIIFIICPDIL